MQVNLVSYSLSFLHSFAMDTEQTYNFQEDSADNRNSVRAFGTLLANGEHSNCLITFPPFN